MGELIPELYPHGLAEGDFELALRGLLGRRGAAVEVLGEAARGEVDGGARGVEPAASGRP